MIDLKLNDMNIEVIQKKIKYIRLTVYPPTGFIKVSAPKNMRIEKIHDYIFSKLEWINKQKEKIRAQRHQPEQNYLDGENHNFKGQRFLLKIVEHDGPTQVTLTQTEIVLQIRPNTDKTSRQSALETWYSQQLKEIVIPLIAQWEKKMNVSVSKFTIRKMKTRWGSCTPKSRSIRINLELAKKSLECIEYLVVHELTHLLEPSHNSRFVALMDQWLPHWRFYRKQLNNVSI